MKSKTLIRRLGAALMTMLLCIAMVLPVFADETELTLDAGEISGLAGSVVELPVNVTVNPGFAGLQFDVTLGEGLSPVFTTNAKECLLLQREFAVNMVNVTYDAGAGVIHLAFVRATNATDTGLMLKLKLRIAADAEAGVAIPVSLSYDGLYAAGTETARPITAAFEGGSVTPYKSALTASDGTSYDEIPEKLVYVSAACEGGNALMAVYGDDGRLLKLVQFAEAEDGIVSFDQPVDNRDGSVDHIKIFYPDAGYNPLAAFLEIDAV